MELKNILLLAISLAALVILAGCKSFIIASSESNRTEPVIEYTEAGTNADLTRKEGMDVVAKDAAYFGNAKGYLAMPAEEGTYPGVIMIHEWWGLNDHIKDMARQLAAEGYVVLAVDLYNGEVAANSSRAGQLAGSVRSNLTSGTDNMKAAVAYLHSMENVRDDRIASMGWCFGGQMSLQLALTGTPLQATVIYYGSLETNASRLAVISQPVLGIFGAEDTGIPVESVNAFEASLDSLGIENSINIYPGVGHAFANPSGANYAPEETVDAWEKTLAFLEENLKQ